jgi:hypothetical protein
MSQLFSSGHLVHTLLFGLPTLAILIAAVVERFRPNKDRSSGPVSYPRTPAIWLLAAFSVAAGAVHASVISYHFHEYALFGWFFVVAAVAQLGSAALVLRRPSPTLVLAAFLGNAMVVLLWLDTRLIGLPVGPEFGSKEEIGALDVFATVDEVLIVAVAAYALLQMRARREAVRTADTAGVPSGHSSRIAPVAQTTSQPGQRVGR